VARPGLDLHRLAIVERLATFVRTAIVGGRGFQRPAVRPTVARTNQSPGRVNALPADTATVVRVLTWCAAFCAPVRLALTKDLSGETSRLLDDIRDRQFLLTSGALIDNAMCVEKACSGRCLDRKIHVLRHVPDHQIQLAHDDTNQIPARVENWATAVSQLHRGGDLDLMRIVERAGQSGYDPGGYVPSGCQKLRERKSEHDSALAGARGTPYSESGSGLGTLIELQQCQIVILVNRNDLCDAGLPATLTETIVQPLTTCAFVSRCPAWVTKKPDPVYFV
jgi:hypothetical protein